MFVEKSIEDIFGIQIAISPLMGGKQKLYRSIVRGEAPWNDKDTPSLMLAASIGAEVARKVTIGLESEIEGSARAQYLNDQYKKVKEVLRTAIIAACNGGEIIFKPYMVPDGLEVTISETDCYWPIAYNVRDELIDVVFGATIRRDKCVYKLLERHTFDEESQSHVINYRAFKSGQSAQGFAPDNLGNEVSLEEVQEWAHLQDMTIRGIAQPLFVHFKMPSSDAVEKPQRQGLPIWSKAVEMLRKADQQEARTDWEFEGGELAIDASIELFRPSGIKKGEASKSLEFPKGKERLFRTLDIGSEKFQMKEFAPQFRIEGLDTRMNQILRRIEFSCGLSYGILSDVSDQEKTATEVLSSKDRFYTTVSDIQKVLEDALKNLIASFDALADLQGVQQGDYEVSFTWDDSIMADRPREFEERVKAQAAGWLSSVENRAWWLGVDVDSEEAKKVPQGMESEF